MLKKTNSIYANEKKREKKKNSSIFISEINDLLSVGQPKKR